MEYITTANVLAWVFVTLGLFMMFLSYWLAATALFPRLVERCEEKFARPILITLIGFFMGILPIILGGIILKSFPVALKWIGLFMIAAPLFIGLLGSAGLARRIGRGMHTPLDESQPWRATLRGGTVLSLTFLLPVLGQLLLIPLTLAAGIGAWSFALKQRKNPPPLLASELSEIS
jgi:hypothetical protein